MNATIQELSHRIQKQKALYDLFELDIHHIEALEREAFRFYAQGYYEQATTMLNGIRGLDPTRAYPHVLLGDVHLRQFELEEAKACFEKANELKPNDPCTLSKLGETHLRLQNNKEAKRALKKVVRCGEADSVYVKRAQLLLQRLT